MFGKKKEKYSSLRIIKKERVLVAMERVSVVVEEVRLWNLGF